jgi:hypothetical protein
VYDAGLFNDRLLLGLKGTMSEAELHILKARMLEGRRAKAQRGELLFNLPRGYVRGRTGEIVFDSDDQVQATVRLVFDTFERRRTINGVLSYLVAHNIQLPFRVRSGAAKGELEWHAPNRHTLSEMLRSPLYAGAYAYGRRGDRRGKAPGQRGTDQPVAETTILLRDRLPAYISWETYERNLQQVAANRSAHRGIPRGGPALLAGLVVCGRCGQRMAAQYPNSGRFQRYICSRLAVNYGAPTCQSLSGRALNTRVGEVMLQALEPAALEVSLQLAEDLELERAGLHRQWQQRLERARYEVDRARRQYDAVEPENRLVVRTLEQRWETALADELRLKGEHERYLAEQPLPLTQDERAAIRRLACDIPALWTAPTTTAADRQAIARLMLERVILTVQGESEIVLVECHWAGGTRTQHDLRRPVARLTQLSDHAPLLERIRGLHAEGQKAPAIALILNTEGWQPPKRRESYTAAMVRDLLHRIGAPVAKRTSLADQLAGREANELTIDELALRLGAPRSTVHRWIQRGVVVARKLSLPAGDLWLIRADEAEIARLSDRRQRSAYHPTTPNEP